MSGSLGVAGSFEGRKFSETLRPPPIKETAEEDSDNIIKRRGSKTNRIFLLGVCGGTASGKTSVCNRIINDLGDVRVALISMDCFYKGLKKGQDATKYNFDHPDAFDYDIFFKTLSDLAEGGTVDIPVYSFVTHSRLEDQATRMTATPVVIVEGILVFHDARIRDLFNMKVFVDTDADTRLLRRIRRDVAERGRSYQSVLDQYEMYVKPSYDEFIAPSKKYADIIIPHWPNEAAVDLITQHVRSKVGMQDLRRVYSNLKIMPHNAQCRQLHTIVRDRTTSLTDFVFYADRLFRLVIEYGLGHLPFRDDMVETPLGCEYSGSKGPETFDRICAVSLVRAGEAMESALMQVCKNVRIGKVLLRFSKTKSEWQTSEGFEKPSVIYCKLPPDIRDRYVLVLDPCVGRGWAGQEVVRLLKEKGVCERNICMVTIIAAPEGITRLCGTFPEMKFVTTEIDAGVNEKGFIIPGIGNFADRYFGTEDTENVFFAATPAQTETEGRGSQFALRLSVGSSSGGRTNSPTASRSPTRSLRAEAVPAPQRDPEPFFLDPLPEQQEREGEGE